MRELAKLHELVKLRELAKREQVELLELLVKSALVRLSLVAGGVALESWYTLAQACPLRLALPQSDRRKQFSRLLLALQHSYTQSFPRRALPRRILELDKAYLLAQADLHGLVCPQELPQDKGKALRLALAPACPLALAGPLVQACPQELAYLPVGQRKLDGPQELVGQLEH